MIRDTDGRPLTAQEVLDLYKPNLNIKNSKTRNTEIKVANRAGFISEVYGQEDINMNDTDILLVLILLSRSNCNTVRAMVHRVAKKLGLPTNSQVDTAKVDKFDNWKPTDSEQGDPDNWDILDDV
jgi:uncharacterized ubiquitin-like protein YukD